MSWQDRLSESNDQFEYSYVSVDGTDCRIQEPTPFSSRWYSHKFSGPGLRYELGISHSKGYIVWLNGPFPCGAWPDLKIFKHRLEKCLLPGEKVVADNGYLHDRCVTPISVSESGKRVHSLMRARHETCNARLKYFNVLNYTFRHSIAQHGVVFHAVTKLVALSIKSDEPLFAIN